MNIGLQCFLKFGDICHIYFRDMGYFSKLLTGYGILGPPPPFQSLNTRSADTLIKLRLHDCVKYNYVDQFEKNKCKNNDKGICTYFLFHPLQHKSYDY